MTSRIPLGVTTIGALLVAVILAEPAQAQTADAHWGPWLGCWDLLVQTPRLDPRVGLDDTTADVSPAPRAGQVCVEPAGGGVTMRTLVDGAPALEQTIVADGVARQIAHDECRGTERAWWSSNGLRLISEARLSCAGALRTVSGLAFIGSDGRWVDVQSVRVDMDDTVRIRHFEPGRARASGRNLAAAALTIADVRELSGQVSASTLEAAILESRSRFPLSAETLVALGDAGVPGSVTDLMVAVTFPEEFRVERLQPDDRVAHLDRYPVVRASRWWGPQRSYYDRYYYSPYYYSPFGYAYLGQYPTTIIVVTGDGGGRVGLPGDGSGPRLPARPRVINGLGYTRVQTGGSSTDENSAGSGSGQAGARVTPRGTTRSGSTNSSNSSTASTTADSSSASDADEPDPPRPPVEDTGRRAVPR